MEAFCGSQQRVFKLINDVDIAAASQNGKIIEFAMLCIVSVSDEGRVDLRGFLEDKQDGERNSACAQKNKGVSKLMGTNVETLLLLNENDHCTS